MMKIDQGRLATFVRLIRALVPECRLMITADGLNTMAVDAANVAMVSVRLPKDAFEQYGVQGDELGMDVTKWKAALDICENSPIEIGQEKDKIVIRDGCYTYTHAPLDPSTVRKRPNMPNLSLAATTEVDAKELFEAVKAMGVVGEKVRFTMKGVVLEISAEGDTDKLVKEIEPKGGRADPSGMATALFSLDYLADIARAVKDAGTVTIHMKTDNPVRFDCDIDQIEVSYLLAPRLEGD
jgi:proliferating cell nuclear antigen